MVKKITAIALIILTLIMGVSGTNAQVIKPILSTPNDNLLRNSGWSENTNGYIITNGTLDTENKVQNCGVIHQTISGEYLYVQSEYVPVVKGTQGLNVSFKYDCDIGQTIEITYAIRTKSKDGETEWGTFPGSQFTTTDSKGTRGLTIYLGDREYFEIKVLIGIKNVTGNRLTVYQPKLEYGISRTLYCPSIHDNVKWDYPDTFQSQKVGDIQNITEYQYKKSLTDVGLFSMTIPLDTPYADEIAEDYYLFVNKKDWLLVQDVKKTETGYIITGTDLKGILATRITLYDVVNDTMGFDSVNGSTEECCKHYVLNNIINPTDTNRIIPLVTLATNQNRGIANDTYMSRFEYLHDVIKKLCENAKIGYTMYADVMNNKIIFDIVNIVDKTIDQQDRNRVVFDENGHNISSYERFKGNSTYKNAFYATKSGGNLESDATTKLCLRDSTAPKGIARKEIHLNVSCESVADIETYAKYQYKDYAKIDSLSVAPADVKGYGVIFDVGDMVTQKIDNDYVNAVIQSAEITYSGGNYNVTVNFGDEQPQPLKYLKTMINNKGV